MASAHTQSGVIKRLVSDKGFGFIKGDDSGVEYFFHRSSVSGGATFEDLQEGTRVSFSVGDGPKGPRAEQVRVG